MPKESNVKAFPEQEASEQTEFNFIEFDFDKLFDGDLKKKAIELLGGNPDDHPETHSEDKNHSGD